MQPNTLEYHHHAQDDISELLEESSCERFVNESARISLIFQYSMVISLDLSLSVIYKYLISMYFLRLVHDAFPLVSMQIALMLSWYRMLSAMLISWAIANSLDHRIMGRGLATPTNSDSVELRVFSFYLVEIPTTVPCPRVMCAPVCPCMSLCTAKAASTDQYIFPFSSNPRMRGKCGYIYRYFMTHVSFL